MSGDYIKNMEKNGFEVPVIYCCIACCPQTLWFKPINVYSSHISWGSRFWKLHHWRALAEGLSWSYGPDVGWVCRHRETWLGLEELLPILFTQQLAGSLGCSVMLNGCLCSSPCGPFLAAWQLAFPKASDVRDRDRERRPWWQPHLPGQTPPLLFYSICQRWVTNSSSSSRGGRLSQAESIRESVGYF